MALVHHFLVFLSLVAIVAKSDDSLGTSCYENITSNKISSNIQHLIPILAKGTIKTGYIATSYGKQKDQVYGLAQCRADVSSKDCSNCIKSAAKLIVEECSNKAKAQIWYDYCLLRYSTQNFITKVDTSFGFFKYDSKNITDPKAFHKKLRDVMNDISSQAILPKNKGNGKKKTKLSNSETLYGLVQCTRDLSSLSCRQCLAIAIGWFPEICKDKKGCRGLYSNCYVRYELYPFYFPLSPDEKMGSS